MKKTLLLAMSLLLMGSIFAQTATFENIRKVKLKNSGEIIRENIVVGYYFFYEYDRNSKTDVEYRLEILDENLGSVASKKVTGTKFLYALESTFNGEEIAFKFYESKKKELIFHKYNTKAELVNKSSRILSGKEAKYLVATYFQSGKEIDNNSFYGVGDKGFVSYILTRDGNFHYEIEFIPNGKEKGWKKAPVKNAQKVEMASFLDANNDYILSTVGKRDKLLSSDMNFYVKLMSTKDGKTIFEKPTMSKKYEVTPMNGFIEENGEVLLLGIYTDKDEKTAKAKSLGVVQQRYSSSGELIQEKFISWAKDFSKFLSVNEKGKIEDAGFIFFHKMIKTDDGEYFVVGEEYKKVASGAGIASRALGGGGSIIDMKIDDINIYKFDSDFNLTDVRVFEKSHTKYGLPEGAGVMSGPLLATYLNALGAFDYSFTQKDLDNKSFVVGYINFDREGKRKDRGNVFGAVKYVDGEFKTDKIPLSTDATNIRVYPGKPGFVLLGEYYKKEKKYELRLEKLNF